jgi:hypothetical protein
MEEYVEINDLMSGTLESIVIDWKGREWKLGVYSSQGYPPVYTARVNEKKLPGGPFEEQAHSAALKYIEERSATPL